MTPTKYPNGYFKDKQCKTCGTLFTPTSPCHSYCTPACRGKNSYYVRNYGLTETEYNAMKEAQDNKCAICHSEGFLIGKNNHTEKLAVDHDHRTGKVRALLCHNCNRALGLFKDNYSILRTAAEYIKEHSESKQLFIRKRC